MSGRRGRNPLPYYVNPFWFASAGRHRFWRLSLVGSDDINAALAGIEMASAPGGADFAASAVAITASSEQIPRPATNLIDGDPTTSWESNGPITGQWVVLEFATPQTLAELRLTPRDSGFHVQAPTVFFVNASNDGVTWVTYQLCIGSTWAASTPQTFAVGDTPLGTTKADAQVWLMDITANNGSTNTVFAELVFASSPGGATLTTGGRHFANEVLAGFPSSNLFDADAATSWATTNLTGGAGTVGYAWPAPPATPVEQRVQARNSAPADQPRDWTVKWTADGITYTTAATVTGETGWTASEWRSYVLT